MERLGGIFSRFSAEGVGGGVAEIAFDDTWLKTVAEYILNNKNIENMYTRNKIRKDE